MSCLIVVGLATIILSALASNAALYKVPTRHTGRKVSGIHLPIYTRGSPALRRRDGQTGAIGLGDFLDV